MIDYADKSYLSFDRPSYRETALEIAQEQVRLIKARGWEYVPAQSTDIRKTFERARNMQ